ncbi:MAG: hypothetical protein ACRDLT_13815, partial [Solirubrobacteraceae bacterium]
ALRQPADAGTPEAPAQGRSDVNREVEAGDLRSYKRGRLRRCCEEQGDSFLNGADEFENGVSGAEASAQLTNLSPVRATSVMHVNV